jgi:ribosomal protein S18 acetylase RimI-like enzyme
MEVRLLSPSDAESYWELRLEALKLHPEAFSTSYEEALQRKDPVAQTRNNITAQGSYNYGAFDGSSLIGVVALVQEQHVKMRHRANIYAMYVSPKNRGTGAGKALLTAAINQARRLPDIEKLNLSVVSTNEKAKNLYKSLGFKTFGYEEKALQVNGTFYAEDHMVLFLK